MGVRCNEFPVMTYLAVRCWCLKFLARSPRPIYYFCKIRYLFVPYKLYFKEITFNKSLQYHEQDYSEKIVGVDHGKAIKKCGCIPYK